MVMNIKNVYVNQKGPLQFAAIGRKFLTNISFKVMKLTF